MSLIMKFKNFYIYSVIFIINLLIFSLGKKPFKTVDTIGTRLIPVSILNEFNMDLNEFFGSPEKYLEENVKNFFVIDSTFFLEITEDGKKYYHPWYITVQKEKFYTSYPIVYPMLNIPFYMIAKLISFNFQVTLFDINNKDSKINKLDNFIASFWTALGGLFLFILLYKQYGFKYALIINLIYCIATPAFSLLSHNTWQHTLLVPVLFLMLLLLDSKNDKIHYFIGILLGLLPFIRPTGVFFYPLIFLTKKKYWREWFIGALIPVIIFLGLHLYIYSHPLGGYYHHYKMINIESISITIHENLTGLLFSPSRGLFPFMPYLIIVFILIIYLAIKRNELRFKIFILLIPFCLHLFYYSTLWYLWHGGWSYGPRFLSDNLPIFMILISIVFMHFDKYKIFNIIMGFLFFLSFLIHLQPNISDKFLKWEVCYNHPEGYYKKVMDWTNPIFLAYLRDLRLLWKDEVFLNYKDLCFIHDRINGDGSVNFSISDFKKVQSKFENNNLKLDKYYYLYMNNIYLPKGNYELEIKDFSEDLYIGLINKRILIEENLKKGTINVLIPWSDYYSFFVYSKEPITYTFYYIKLKKLDKIK